MYRMFNYALVFNNNNSWTIGSWNTLYVTNMRDMFSQAYVFNQNIGGWQTQNVTDMYGLFYNAYAFNQNLGSWNTQNVTNMRYMFYQAGVFNNDNNSSIGNWNTSKVTNMMCMFHSATKFNEPLDHWDISSVPHKHENGLKYMFRGALAYEFSPLDPIDKSAYIWQSTKDDYIPGHICKR